MAEPIDYSKTERIVLVIDLHPLFVLQNPNAYLRAVVASIKRLLNFPPLCNSLFAYRLFFSSLSPLRSASVVHRLLPNPTLTSLSFNGHFQTLISLVKILDSLSTAPLVAELSDVRPFASYTAGALLQLVHDYSWEADLGTLREKGENSFPLLRSNLVVLFSPICCSICSLVDYLGVIVKSRDLNESDEILEKFCNVFGAVTDALVSRDIHFSWVNVKYDLEGSENEFGKELGLFEEGIRNLGCGFCSTDSVVLGSALIPFRLIYPKIGIPFKFLNLNSSYQRSDVQLCLGILDVNGKPLECNCCYLEMLNLKTLSRDKSDDVWNSFKFGDSQSEKYDISEPFWGRFSDGMIKLCIKTIQKYNEREKIPGSSSDIILVKEFPGDSRKRRKVSSDEFFADRVLDILSGETNGTSNWNPTPIWQILMSFLSSEGYWALVSLSNSNGDAVLGILKPFTSHLALLSIVSNDCLRVYDFQTSYLGKIQDRCAGTCNSNMFAGSQTENSTSGDHETLGARKKNKNRKHEYEGLTWASFCKAAFECSDTDLSAIYFARKFEKNKKLQFLKCWMKQIIRYSQQNLQMLHSLKSMEKQTPKPSNASSEHPEKQEEAMMVSCSQTAETFFNNIPKRVQLGLESGVHVQTLAEQLVKSSIHWLLQISEKNENAQVQHTLPVDISCKSLSEKLMKLLLRDPKEMTSIDNGNDPSSKSCNPNSISEVTVRRYELQVFLRMEIFQLYISTGMEEPLKQKLLKQICSFLDIIQYLIEGGIHGNVSLYDYVERTIKTRYYHVLEDIVKDIYVKMDLLPFGDEDETRAFLFNSEDSSQSWRDKELYDKSESQDIHQSISVEDETNQHKENVGESPEGITKEEHARKLSEARARRERARRFVSFTSWMPDLQRVWAPKLLKGVKGGSVSVHKDFKRKDSRIGSCSVVCETPLSGRKRPCSREIGEGDKECKDPGSYSYSASKALFQDN